MRPCTRILLWLAACSLGLGTAGWTPPALGQSAPSLRQRMGDSRFHAAGLDKLSAQELARLESWLRTHPDRALPPSTATTTRARGDATEPGAPLHKAARRAVTSRIQGVLHGWSGKTVFRLQNGQVWQQRGNDTWSAGKALDHPEATIKPAAFGSWLLRIDGYNASTRVERIR